MIFSSPHYFTFGVHRSSHCDITSKETNASHLHHPAARTCAGLRWLRAGSQAANFGVLPLLPTTTNQARPQAETEAEEGMAVPVPSLSLSSHRFVSTTTCGWEEGRKRGKWQAASWTGRFFPQLPGFARAAWKNEQANRRGEEEVMNGAAFGSTTRSRSRGPFRNADADQVKRRRRRFQMMPHLILLVAPCLLLRWPKLGKSLRRLTFSCNFPIITRLY